MAEAFGGERCAGFVPAVLEALVAMASPAVPAALCLACSFETVEHTLSAIFSVCLRAGYQDYELTPELLLTTLWMSENWFSQSRWLSSCLYDYLFLNPFARGLQHQLQDRMRTLQIQVGAAPDFSLMP